MTYKLNNPYIANIYVLFGWPLKYSLSPVIHNAVFGKSNKNSIYFAQPVKPEHFPKALETMIQLNWKGANITIPYKQEVLQHLNYTDDLALRIGAVNTIINDSGKLKGYNTDLQGFLMSLPSGLDKNGEVICLGAGGAALSVVTALADIGFHDIAIINRTLQNAKKLKQNIIKNYPYCKIKLIQWDELAVDSLRNKELIVNCTPVDFPCPREIINNDLFFNTRCVYDLRYGLDNNLLLAMAAANEVVYVQDGVEMLIWQAALAQKIWTNEMPSIIEIREALRL